MPLQAVVPLAAQTRTTGFLYGYSLMFLTATFRVGTGGRSARVNGKSSAAAAGDYELREHWAGGAGRKKGHTHEAREAACSGGAGNQDRLWLAARDACTLSERMDTAIPYLSTRTGVDQLWGQCGTRCSQYV